MVAPMKKRLRKKLKKGEFREFGREVTVRMAEGADADSFVDSFISMIETEGLVCGGGGNDEGWTLVLELGNTTREEKWAKVRSWLAARTDIADWNASPEFDLWHGMLPSEAK